MKASAWFVVFIVLIAIGAAVWWVRGMQPAPAPVPARTDIIAGVNNATYTNSRLSFSIQYPSIAASSTFSFDGYLPLTQTPVASFVLPDSMYQGTNLGNAGVYIGATTTPIVMESCEIAMDNNGETAVGTTTIGGQDFAAFTASDAAAGNRYESKIFRTYQNGACLEIVELLHYGVIENYPAGSVAAFDHAKFSGILDAIVKTYHPTPTGI